MNKFTRWRNTFLMLTALSVAAIFGAAVLGCIVILPLFCLVFTLFLTSALWCHVKYDIYRQMLFEKQTRYIIVNTMLADISVTKLDAPSENTGERIILFDD